MTRGRVQGSGAALGSIFQRAEGVTLRGLGFDGQTYQLSICTEPGSGEFSYVHDFSTPRSPAGAPVSVTLPFRDFRASWRGRVIDKPPLRGEAVVSVGLLLSLKSADGRPNRAFGDGPFQFVLEDLAPVGAVDQAVQAVSTDIAATLSRPKGSSAGRSGMA